MQKNGLIRNHGEAVITNKSKKLVNILGYNFRMGEIEAVFRYNN